MLRWTAVTGGVSRLLLMGVLLGFGLAGSVYSQDQPADPVATRKYSVALGFQKKKLYDQAAARWQEFIKAYPKSARLATAGL